MKTDITKKNEDLREPMDTAPINTGRFIFWIRRIIGAGADSRGCKSKSSRKIAGRLEPGTHFLLGGKVDSGGMQALFSLYDEPSMFHLC